MTADSCLIAIALPLMLRCFHALDPGRILAKKEVQAFTNKNSNKIEKHAVAKEADLMKV